MTNTSTDAGGGPNTPSASHDDQHPLDADAEADARRGLAAHLLDETVVATAAADRVLRGVERVALELERRAGVVVEAAHETRRDLEVDAERVQARLHASRSRPRPRR